MSEKGRVELIRAGFDAWERGDVEEALGHYHPEVETFAPPEIGNSGTFHGIDGFMQWTQAWFEAWESFDQELISVEPIGETHVLQKVMQTGRGKGSGIEVKREATYVYDIRGEKLAFIALFFTHEDALALALEREASD